MTAIHQPPAEALAGMREVARVSTSLSDEDLAQFLSWAVATYGSGLAAQGGGEWLTIYAPSRG